MEYTSPKIEVVEFETKDVITTSNSGLGPNETEIGGRR